MRTAIALWLLAGGLLLACKTTPPQPVNVVAPSTIWAALVDAGCAALDDGGPAAVQQQEAFGSAPWLTCMQAGGTVKSCNVPCK